MMWSCPYMAKIKIQIAGLLAHERRHHTVDPKTVLASEGSLFRCTSSSTVVGLHDHAAPAVLRGSVRIFTSWYGTPYRRYHVVPCAIAVRNYAVDADV